MKYIELSTADLASITGADNAPGAQVQAVECSVKRARILLDQLLGLENEWSEELETALDEVQGSVISGGYEQGYVILKVTKT